ncbi:hypothetical protein [Nocardia brasiliensis]|uniref:hypothetical protein n=1 Tax=Nocardia brasiliensis TaxID=37326 RepID=UPI00245677F5|nr:hypothetical protein [Nocardia brasiliensis]
MREDSSDLGSRVEQLGQLITTMSELSGAAAARLAVGAGGTSPVDAAVSAVTKQASTLLSDRAVQAQATAAATSAQISASISDYEVTDNNNAANIDACASPSGGSAH